MGLIQKIRFSMGTIMVFVLMAAAAMALFVKTQHLTDSVAAPGVLPPGWNLDQIGFAPRSAARLVEEDMRGDLFLVLDHVARKRGWPAPGGRLHGCIEPSDRQYAGDYAGDAATARESGCWAGPSAGQLSLRPQ